MLHTIHKVFHNMIFDCSHCMREEHVREEHVKDEDWLSLLIIK